MAASISTADLPWLASSLVSPLTLVLSLVVPFLYLSWKLRHKAGNAAIVWTLFGRPGQTDTNGERDGARSLYEHEMTVPCAMGEVRISKILVHPIKSCRGTSVAEARYTIQGLEHDRKWCVIDADTHKVVTARTVPKMVLITPRIVPNPASPYDGELVVSFPEDSGCETFSIPLNPTPELLGKWHIVDDCSLWRDTVDGYICETLDESAYCDPSCILSEYMGQSVYLVMKGPRPRPCAPTTAVPDLKATAVFQDGYPLLIASEESLAEVQRKVRSAAHATEVKPLVDDRWREDELEIERFRPNIVFKGAGVPFAEDMWREIVLDCEVAHGLDSEQAEAARTLTVLSKCTRCLLPNVDPTSGTRDAAVPYKVLLTFRKDRDPAYKGVPCFGCNSVLGGEGIVRVGDSVSVRTWANP